MPKVASFSRAVWYLICFLVFVFVCTRTDYAEERNTIMRDAIPRLKAYCERIGFELQVSSSSPVWPNA